MAGRFDLIPNARAFGLALSAALTLLAPCRATAEEHHPGTESDWLFFLSGQAVERYDRGYSAHGDKEFVNADILYTHSRGRFRVLAETDLGSDDHEVERLQVGWQLRDDTLVWAGRFHQPASAWNTEHHHGQYLQTAITRPNIEHWEDEAGLIPQHIAGALQESQFLVGDGHGLAMSLGAGVAPVLGLDGLDPVRVLHSNEGGHRLSLSGRLAFLPELLGEDGVGIVIAHHDIRVVDTRAASVLGARDAALSVGGLFGKLGYPDWKLQSAIYYIDTHLTGGSEPHGEHFAAGYLQGERAVSHRFTVFARAENSANTRRSAYVALRARDFEVRRNLVGLRWDVAPRQALTIEAARSATLLASFDEIRLQWSGVLP